MLSIQPRGPRTHVCVWLPAPLFVPSSVLPPRPRNAPHPRLTPIVESLKIEKRGSMIMRERSGQNISNCLDDVVFPVSEVGFWDMSRGTMDVGVALAQRRAMLLCAMLLLGCCHGQVPWTGCRSISYISVSLARTRSALSIIYLIYLYGRWQTRDGQAVP